MHEQLCFKTKSKHIHGLFLLILSLSKYIFGLTDSNQV